MMLSQATYNTKNLKEASCLCTDKKNIIRQRATKSRRVCVFLPKSESAVYFIEVRINESRGLVIVTSSWMLPRSICCSGFSAPSVVLLALSGSELEWQGETVMSIKLI